MDRPAFEQRDRSIFVGCAGWSLPSAVQDRFPATGSQLERYAALFPAVEINTSFYRPHRPSTYARWRDSVPDAFRFAAKVPKAITHELRLRQASEPLKKFIDEVSHLDHKLGCLLVQLPPRLHYDPELAWRFFARLRDLTNVALVCEARHASWFTGEAAAMLAEFEAAQVIADPQIAPLPDAAHKMKTEYFRLHGSPVMYYSSYPDDYLDRLAVTLDAHARSGRQVWCVFDNTAQGAAVPNALGLMARLESALA